MFPAEEPLTPIPLSARADDPFQSKEVNYHYLLVEVDQKQLKVTMNRLDLTTGKAVWTQPDSVKITVPAAAAAQAAAPLGPAVVAWQVPWH